MMPITHLEKHDFVVKPFLDKNTAMMMEIMLQNSGKIKRIVDHSETLRVLEELKISSLNEGNAANIGKLIGADKIITGTVSKANFNKDKLRLDLFLVDTGKAMILNSESSICNSRVLADTAGALVLKLLEKVAVVPAIQLASQKQKDKEAKLYRDMAAKARMTKGYRIPLSRFIASNIEAAYYLNKDNVASNRELCRTILDTLKYLRKKMPAQTAENLVFILKDVKGQLDRQGMAISKRDQSFYDYIVKYDFNNKRKIKESENREIGDEIYALIKKEDLAKAAKLVEQIPKPGVMYSTYASLVYRKLKNENKELAALENHAFQEAKMHSEAPYRLVKLMNKLKGPEKALAYVKKYFYRWELYRPEIQFEIAKCFLAIDQPERAARILKRISADTQKERVEFISQKEFQREITELQDEISKFAAKGKTPAQIRNFSRKYKLYLQPIGQFNQKLLKRSAKQVAEFWGAKVVILPQVDYPDNPKCYNKIRAQYHAGELLKQIRDTQTVPEDALLIVNLCEEDIYAPPWRAVYSYFSPDAGSIISTQRWLGFGSPEVISDLLVKAISQVFQKQYLASGQKNNPNLPQKICDVPYCVMSKGDYSFTGAKDKSLLMCPQCQEKI